MRKGSESFNRAKGVPRVDVEGYDQGVCVGETRGKLIPRLVKRDTETKLNFDSFKSGKLELRSVDWCLETSRRNFGSLQDVGSITEGLGDDVGSIPFALEFGGMRLAELSKMTIDSVTFLEGRRHLILVLQFLTSLDPFLCFLAVFGKGSVENFDPFLEFLSGSWLAGSTIMVNVDWKSEFLIEEEVSWRTSGCCLVDCAICQ